MSKFENNEDKVNEETSAVTINAPKEEDVEEDKEIKQDTSLQQEKKKIYKFFFLSNISRNNCDISLYSYVNFYEYV